MAVESVEKVQRLIDLALELRHKAAIEINERIERAWNITRRAMELLGCSSILGLQAMDALDAGMLNLLINGKSVLARPELLADIEERLPRIQRIADAAARIGGWEQLLRAERAIGDAIEAARELARLGSFDEADRAIETARELRRWAGWARRKLLSLRRRAGCFNPEPEWEIPWTGVLGEPNA